MSKLLQAGAALFLLNAAGTATAQTVYVNDPNLKVTAIDTIVVGTKYRLSPTNFDQSLDSGGGTNLTSGGANFLGTNLGNHSTLNGVVYDFTFEHRAGEGFIYTMTSPTGSSWTQAWGTFIPAILPAPNQAAAQLPVVVATGLPDGTLTAPGLAFNALHLEARASLRGNITVPSVTYSNLTFTTPGLTQVGTLITGYTALSGVNPPNPNFPDPNADYQSQWFVADTNLATQDFTIAGKVSLATATFTGGNIDESLRFDISGKNVAFALVPEPATWAMLISGFGMVGAGLRRQRRSAAVAD